MLDQELTVEIVVEMYEEKIVILKKEIDRLNEEIQVLNLELKKEREK
jgi:predicted HTH domain antitoxin